LMKALYMDYGFYIWILKCDMVWNGAGISCVLWIISKEKLYTTEFNLFGCGLWKSGPRPSCFSANRGTVTILSGEYVFLISSLCPALNQPGLGLLLPYIANLSNNRLQSFLHTASHRHLATDVDAALGFNPQFMN